MRLKSLSLAAVFSGMVSFAAVAADVPTQADMSALEGFATDVLIASGYRPEEVSADLELPRDVTDRTAFAGTVSGLADWCRTDLGQRNFAAGLVLEQRQSGAGKERMNHVAALHLSTRDLILAWLPANRGECTTDVRDLVVRVVGALPDLAVIQN